MLLFTLSMLASLALTDDLSSTVATSVTTWAGNMAFCPKTISYGVTLVAAWMDVLYAKTAGLMATSQFALPSTKFDTNGLIFCTNDPFTLSTKPFPSGWYAAVNFWSTPHSVVHCRNALLVKADPESVNILTGVPNWCMKFSFKNLIT